MTNSLLEAKEYLNNEMYQDALEKCVYFIEYTFHKRLDIVIIPAFKPILYFKNTLQLGFQSGRLGKIFINPDYNSSSISKLIECLWKIDKNIPKQTFPEKLYILIRNLSDQYYLKVNPKPDHYLNRRIYKLLSRIKNYLFNKIDICDLFVDKYFGICCEIFNMPKKYSTQLAKDYCYYTDKLYYDNMNTIEMLSNKSLEISYQWDNREVLDEATGVNQGAVILAPIHMGSFVGAISKVKSLFPEHMKWFAIRHFRPDDKTKTFFSKLNSEFEILQKDPASYLRAASLIRKGSHSLMIFFDLSGQFGECVKVKFFNREARFVTGPAKISIVTKAPIVPCYTYDFNEVRHIVFGEIINPCELKTEDESSAVSLITQKLALFTEDAIRRSPTQWKFFRDIPTYFN